MTTALAAEAAERAMVARVTKLNMATRLENIDRAGFFDARESGATG